MRLLPSPFHICIMICPCWRERWTARRENLLFPSSDNDVWVATWYRPLPLNDTVLTSFTKHRSDVTYKTTLLLYQLQNNTVLTSFLKQQCSYVIYNTPLWCHLQNTGLASFTKHCSAVTHKTKQYLGHSQNITILTPFPKHCFSVTHN